MPAAMTVRGVAVVTPPHGLVVKKGPRERRRVDMRSYDKRQGGGDEVPVSMSDLSLRVARVHNRQGMTKMYGFLMQCQGAEQMDAALTTTYLQGAFKYMGILDKACLLAVMWGLLRGVHVGRGQQLPPPPAAAASQPPEAAAAEAVPFFAAEAYGLPKFTREAVVKSFEQQGALLGDHLGDAVWLAGMCGVRAVVEHSAAFLAELGVAEHTSVEELRKIAVACVLVGTSAPLYQVCLEVELRAHTFPLPALLSILRSLAARQYVVCRAVDAMSETLRARLGGFDSALAGGGGGGGGTKEEEEEGTPFVSSHLGALALTDEGRSVVAPQAPALASLPCLAEVAFCFVCLRAWDDAEFFLAQAAEKVTDEKMWDTVSSDGLVELLWAIDTVTCERARSVHRRAKEEAGRDAGDTPVPAPPPPLRLEELTRAAVKALGSRSCDGVADAYLGAAVFHLVLVAGDGGEATPVFVASVASRLVAAPSPLPRHLAVCRSVLQRRYGKRDPLRASCVAA